MNLHEYQAKELLKSFNLPILNGKHYIGNLDSMDKDLDQISNNLWIVKSQIHAGGRGAGHFKKAFNKKGGVQIAKSKKEAIYLANSMLGNVLVTKQTGIEGKKVNRVFIEAGCEIVKEFYLSLIIDRKISKLMLMLSSAGGMDIEEIAEKNPNKIEYIHIENSKEIQLNKNLENLLNIQPSQLSELNEIVNNLIKAFYSIDASSIEINPLVLDTNEKFVLLDSKITLDDNALFRHPEFEDLKDISEENFLELKAEKYNMNYVKLNGSIGCMVNGAGLAMATMDMIKLYGKAPANFLDLGGTANKERAIEGFKIIQSDPNVKSVFINIFGGIIRCDMIATGIIEAIRDLNFKLPLVIRFQGTNAEEGKNIINNSNSNIISIDDFSEAAKKAVKLSQ